MSKYFVVEGLIGVGKTSLCRLMERIRGAKLVLEPCVENPFLADFYADPKHYAFPAQMFYLASRYQQQLTLTQNTKADDLMVADYLFDKDRLFAEQTLSPSEMSLYNRFAGLLGNHVTVPDFILFLDAPTDIIQKRIARRSIQAEQVIEASYLNSLRERYYRLWDSWTQCPVYVIDTTAMNYVDDPKQAAFMNRMIEGYLEGTPIPNAPRSYQEMKLEDISGFEALAVGKSL